ncbi:hypothetical protein F4604DRAFT_2034969 [Suillus subluteus]|nr:hypothetical protein F4604DRAFT_2034969 [Suillus subluteus]
MATNALEQILSGEEIEVGALGGLPTLKVLSEEEVIQRNKDRKWHRNAGQSTDATGRIVPWWEEWEEGEKPHRSGLQMISGLVVLGHRYLPELEHYGIILPIYRKVNKSKGNTDMTCEGGGDASDNDDTPKAEQIAHLGKQLEPNEGEAVIMACLLETFLEDMEKSIKVFMSSYMQDKVLHFFLHFMQCNRVLAGFEIHTENLNHAVAVAELAIRELPLTARVARVLPGMFNAACKDAGDTKEGSAYVVLDSLMAKEVLHDPFGIDDGVNVSPAPVDDPWAAAITAGQNTTVSWTDVKVDSLLAFLGPTQLPLMHAAGVVEFSMCKVKEIMLPEAINSIPDTPSATIEQELGSRFARVMLEPWVRTSTDKLLDLIRPIITSSSRGAVIKDPFTDIIDVSDTHSPSDAYNPCRDDLAILINPSSIDCLHVGLGLCGTWVQIACCEDVECSITLIDLDQGTPRVSKHPHDCSWYLEDVVSIFPSFYMESEVEVDLGQTTDNDDL